MAWLIVIALAIIIGYGIGTNIQLRKNKGIKKVKRKPTE